MRYIVSMLLICAAVGTAVVMYLTRPKAQRTRHRKPAPLVQTAELRPTSRPVRIVAYGTVIAAKRLTLQAQVEGRIVYQEANLVLGGLIPAGSKLIQIDPNDYKLAVEQQEAAVEEAQFEVDTEQGRRVIAEREWKLLEKEIATSEAGRRLALRQPHQKRAAARLQAARSRLDQARLDQKRTTLLCPFNALVLAESAELTQLVSRQADLATLVGTDQFWVQLSVPLAKLPRIAFPRGGRRGAKAKVVLATANGSAVVREGRVLRLLGDLEPSGQMARVLVAIDNPLDLPTAPIGAGASQPPMDVGPRCLLLGCYVRVEIDAGTADGVYAIPRSAVREGDRLWLVDADGKLVFRDANVLWRLRDEVLVRCEIADGERLVVSRLSSPLPGVTVRVHDPAASAPATESAGQAGPGRAEGR